MRDQSIKADGNKPMIHLVPMEILNCIARVREFGTKKYPDPESWKSVEIERYIDALDRHVMLFNEDPLGFDEESKLPHLWHIACNVAFLCFLLKGKYKDELYVKEYKVDGSSDVIYSVVESCVK